VGPLSQIGFRYALAGDARKTLRVKLKVNELPQPDLVFLSTGESGWHELYVPVHLDSGKFSTIELEGAEPGELLIDELRFQPASTKPVEMDQQNFIALKESHQLDASAPAVRGGYGDFRPVRVTDSQGGSVETFVYPRSAGDPMAEDVRTSFKRQGDDFSSVLGQVKGTLYIGRIAAGGFGEAIDLDGDGKDDLSFDQDCAFIVQHSKGKITAIETDRSVKATYVGRTIALEPYTPVRGSEFE
jgi:hypothetical protein